MSFERKIRRNIRQQQRKALRKYMRTKEQELNAKRKAEARRKENENA